MLNVHDEPCPTVPSAQLPDVALLMASQLDPVYEQSFGVHDVAAGVKLPALHVMGLHVYPGFVNVHT